MIYLCFKTTILNSVDIQCTLNTLMNHRNARLHINIKNATGDLDQAISRFLCLFELVLKSPTPKADKI